METGPALHTLGNTDLLQLHKVAFLCSRSVPADLEPLVREWAERQCADGVCVISGFHSSVEQKVLRYLLAGSQPVILALACGITPRLEAQFQEPLAAGRLLTITRYAASVTHPCREKCRQRNRLMLELADEVMIGYAAAGGELERLCGQYRGRKPMRSIMEASTDQGGGG